jgi:hypothetical protein
MGIITMILAFFFLIALVLLFVLRKAKNGEIGGGNEGKIIGFLLFTGLWVLFTIVSIAAIISADY